jgi:hypothetical protein
VVLRAARRCSRASARRCSRRGHSPYTRWARARWTAMRLRRGGRSPPAQGVSAVGLSLSSARDRAWMPSIHSEGVTVGRGADGSASASETPSDSHRCDPRAQARQWCHRHEERPNHEPPATAWNGFVTTYAVTLAGADD